MSDRQIIYGEIASVETVHADLMKQRWLCGTIVNRLAAYRIASYKDKNTCEVISKDYFDNLVRNRFPSTYLCVPVAVEDATHPTAIVEK